MKTAKGWTTFTELCSKLETAQEVDRFFDLFLTIEEKHLLAARYLIVKKLFEKKLSQRDIAKDCHVSIAQITRGSNALKRISPQTEKFLKENL